VSAITPELRKFLRERERLVRAHTAPAEDPADDPLLAALEKAGPFFDGGWTPASGCRPSDIACIRYCMLMSSMIDGAKQEAESLARSWLRCARQRYRDGFYANPFGEAVRRPEA